VPVKVVDGDPLNLKITTQTDFAMAEWLVAAGQTHLAGIEPPTAGDD